MNVTRIVRDTPAKVTLTTYRDGTATDVGTITLTATKADGTALFTNQPVTDNGNGTYDYSFTAAQTAALNILTLTWSEAGGESYTTYVEIVGGHLFTEAEARAFDNTAMSNATKYTDAKIAEERDRITDLIEQWTDVSWIERFKREQLTGDGSTELLLSRHQVNTVVSATVEGTAQTVGDIDVDTVTGLLTHKTSTWTGPTAAYPRNVVVEYEHGYKQLRDGVDRIALLLLRNRLVPSSIADKATTYSDETGTFRLAGGPSGIPEVNDWIRDHNQRSPV